MIEFKNIQKTFGKQTVLRGIDLSFTEPGITAVLGPNGSGKTTLIKSILGLVIPQSGDVFFNGKALKQNFKYRNEINHLPQIAHFPENLRITELIRLIKDLRSGTTHEKELIRLFEMEDHLEKKINTLSGGMRQKTNLILALMYDCPVLILDEPATGLDPLALIRLKDYLRNERKKGKLVLVTTHSIRFVQEMANRIVFLLDGQVYFDGSVQELLDSQKERDLEHAIAKIFSHDTYSEETGELSKGRIKE